MNNHSSIQALRAALQVSPDNIPLRQHLAETLLSLGYTEEAEQEYRQAARLEPQNPALQLGLAQSFYQQGRTAQALVIVETLLQSPHCAAEVRLLHTRLLLDVGEVQQAGVQYRSAIAADPNLRSADLEERLEVKVSQTAEAVVEHLQQALHKQQARTTDRLQLPTITFKDVGGMEAVKSEIQIKLIAPFQHPELFRAYGKKVGGSILMYGPPGCGKTFLARATAGEMNSKFLSVGINDVLEMWLGNSEKNLHDLFVQARQNQPCVLFFDEVDALAANRSEVRYGAGRTIVNQFLAELDGVQDSNEGILILAATNTPWYLDPAFRRPGRLDRILFIPPPDEIARGEILRILCRGKPVDRLDFKFLSKKTPQFSGADLKAVVDLAIERKLQESLRHGLQPLTTKDLTMAISAIKPSTKEWFANARNYITYANDAGLYDDILNYLKQQ